MHEPKAFAVSQTVGGGGRGSPVVVSCRYCRCGLGSARCPLVLAKLSALLQFFKVCLTYRRTMDEVEGRVAAFDRRLHWWATAGCRISTPCAFYTRHTRRQRGIYNLKQPSSNNQENIVCFIMLLVEKNEY